MRPKWIVEEYFEELLVDGKPVLSKDGKPKLVKKERTVPWSRPKDVNGRPAHFTEGPTKTDQSGKVEADVNNIMARYVQFGVLPPPSKEAKFGDFSDVGSYYDAVNKVVNAEQLFDRYPAHIRAKFDNDPGKLIEWLGHEENWDEAVRLGFMSENPKKKEAPSAPEVKFTQPIRAATGSSTPDGGQGNP